MIMSSSLSTVSPRTLSVGVSEDPYKKYWWVLLAGFAFTGLWLCLPMLGTPVGSVSVNPDKGAAALASGEGGLDVAAAGGNSGGIDGGRGYDLSMGAGAQAKGEPVDGPDASGSSLYQAPADATAGAPVAGGAPLGTATGGSSASLAQALKNAGQGADPSGWGGEKARRGFDAPHLSGGGLGGLGGVSGGNGGSSGGMGAFGARNSQVGASAGQGLTQDGSTSAAPAGAGGSFAALQKISGSATKAARAAGSDAAAGGMNSLFDGAKARGGSGIGPASAAANAAYAALNSAPANLKTNPSGLNQNGTLAPPPSAPVPPTASGSAMGQQLAMMAVGIVVSTVAGGLVSGLMGQMVGAVGVAPVSMFAQQASAAH